jgi:hypothetical protein
MNLESRDNVSIGNASLHNYIHHIENILECCPTSNRNKVKFMTVASKKKNYGV